MSILDLVYALLIGPLELFFEVLYSIAYQLVGDPGISIIFLSLAMNFLVLPLYRRADAMQEAERERSQRMKLGTEHIKKTFKGDERFMIMQTYNRQNGYKPTDALKGSVSLLLEIPFFIAAYHFLSNLPLLHGVSFGPIADLGAPDALIQLGDASINFLPLLMTAINLVSAFVYMKGMPLQNKIQTYGIAAIFLLLLYGSPAGLVFYWTLNNVFSLLKNIYDKLYVKSRKKAKEKERRSVPIPEATKADTRSFVLCGLALALLTGALIPSTVIQASPAEFINLAAYESPLWYVARTSSIAIGTFVVWAGVFYWLATPKVKTVFGCAMLAMLGVAVVDYLLFGLNLGNLSSTLQFEGVPEPVADEVLLNVLAIVVVVLAAVALWKFKRKAVLVMGASLCVAAGVISGVSAVGIDQSLQPVKITADTVAEKGGIRAPLSKDGKNVVVLMMDRAVGQFVPYLLNEKPELKEKMSGFTYYPNATSFGMCTNMGAPGLFGGYDYVPERMNERSDKPLVEKHDEALKLMPSLFMQNGYDATFVNPSYAGYGWVPDLRTFDDMPELNTYITSYGWLDSDEGAGGLNPLTMRNFFCYSLFKVAPNFLQPVIYHRGDYNSGAALSVENDEQNSVFHGQQTTESASVGWGYEAEFMKPYSVLQHLSDMTPVEDGDRNTLMIMANDTTHSPTILKEPEYAPAAFVDNTDFDKAHAVRYAEDGSSMSFPEENGQKGSSRIMHYEINMAALQELCNWFDYLRANDAYDNTRIIIVSDHSRNLWLNDDLVEELSDDKGKTEWYDLLTASCLLMVKDFNSEGFVVDDRFMTNADTPTLAMQGLISDPVNPFTGNPVNSDPKTASDQKIFYSWEWGADTNNGNKFLPGHWFSLHDNINERSNWEYLGYY